MASYPSSGIGGSATIVSPGSEDANRSFSAVSSGVVYASALVNFSAMTTSGNYFMHFMTSSSFSARTYAKDDGSGNLVFGIRDVNGTINYGTNTYSLNTTYLIVTKWDFTASSASVFVLSAVTGSEPAAEATSADGSTVISNANGIALRQSSNIPTGTVDGIRVATTWNDIMNDPVAITPTNHVTGFGSGTITSKTIQLTWTDATGANLPSKYLIVGKKSSAGAYDPASLTDGVSVTVDTDWADNTVAVNVDHGTGNYTFTDLDVSTGYDFKIYPYSEGTGGPKYKTDGTVPEITNVTTVDR